MGMRTIKAAKQRAQQRINRNKAMTAMRGNNTPVDRSETLSTIKRTTFVRG